MTYLSNIELSEICEHLGETKPLKIQQIFGGCINNCWRIDFKDSKFFLKANKREQKLLEFENYCLNDLKKYINPHTVVIPKVIKYFKFTSNEYLLMEWIDINNQNQKKLGRGIAEIHLNSNRQNPKKYGYSLNGFIGTTNQVAGWESNWIDCFIKLRIEPQISFLKNNQLSKNILDKIKSKIKLYLSDHEPLNSLVHGDLWAGNVGTGFADKGIIFDPSCWWADCEVDIAMTRLFGAFKKEFYEEYYKVIKRKDGYKKRMIIYNFYHILNHANMFGGNYLNEVNNYIKILLDM